MSQKLNINQSIYVKLNSIEYAYQKSSIQNISTLMFGQQQITVPNLCNSIGSANCSDIIMTSQVKTYIFFLFF
jgi:hypothetical protein